METGGQPASSSRRATWQKCSIRDLCSWGQGACSEHKGRWQIMSCVRAQALTRLHLNFLLLVRTEECCQPAHLVRCQRPLDVESPAELVCSSHDWVAPLAGTKAGPHARDSCQHCLHQLHAPGIYGAGQQRSNGMLVHPFSPGALQQGLGDCQVAAADACGRGSMEWQPGAKEVREC